MRIVSDYNKNLNYSNSKQPVSFGAIYTKSSIKLLKNLIPEMVGDDEFKFAQKALTNLAQAGKRKDNLILKLKDIDDLGIDYITFHAKHLSENVNNFRKIDIPEGPMYLNSSETFEYLTSVVNSDKFVSKANEILTTEDKLSNAHKVKSSIRERISEISQKIKKSAGEFVNEIFSTTIQENGKSTWSIFDDIKFYTKNVFVKNNNPYGYDGKEKEQAEILAKMIDNLPTVK